MKISYNWLRQFLQIDWDKTLEQGNLNLIYSIYSSQDIDKIISFANNSENRQVIEEILRDMITLPPKNRGFQPGNK